MGAEREGWLEGEWSGRNEGWEIMNERWERIDGGRWW